MIQENLTEDTLHQHVLVNLHLIHKQVVQLFFRRGTDVLFNSHNVFYSAMLCRYILRVSTYSTLISLCSMLCSLTSEKILQQLRNSVRVS